MNNNRVKANRVNILVAAHLKDELDFLSVILSNQGYQVQQAQTKQAALSMLDPTLPDLILLDSKLPQTDTYNFCLSLKTGEKTNQIPVIFLLEHKDLEFRGKVFQVGGVDYIIKPCVAQEIITKVASRLTIINSSKPQQEEDITERIKLCERAIAASSNGIIITDPTQPNNPIIYTSPGYEKISGYAGASAEQKPESWIERVHPEDQKQVISAFHKHLESKIELFLHPFSGKLLKKFAVV